MADQKQTFRFRFPWSTSAAPRPRQTTQAPSSSQSPPQRSPSRPTGPASRPTRLSPARDEPPPASSQASPSSRSMSTTAPQHQIASPTKELGSSPSSRAVSRTPSLSPSREVDEQAKSIAPVTKPPTAPTTATVELEQGSKSISTQKKKPNTRENAEPHKKQSEEATSHQSSPKQPFVDTKTPQTKEVEILKRKDEFVASEETKSKHESRKEVYEASSNKPMDILNQKPVKSSVIQGTAQVSKAKTEDHSDRLSKELDKYPGDETFDQKEIVKIIKGNENSTKSGYFGHEKGSNFNHKHANTEEKAPLDKVIKEDLPKIMSREGIRHDMHARDEKPLSIITLTGENTGAFMHLNSEPAKRERPIHIHRGYKAMPDENVDTVADGEERSRSRNTTDTKAEDELRKKLFVNNNAQGLNNSLVFKSSVTLRDPGAHVVLSHEAAESVRSVKDVATSDTHKAEVRPASADRFAYTPRIRRRCLRGLLQESSDSDPGTSKKPQRHGCRAGLY